MTPKRSPLLAQKPNPAPSAALAERFVRTLGAWYSTHARDLPWRRTRDPYAIWISEAMLQQTRVEAVGEHWRRFLVRFPRVEDLAAASEDEVLAAWSGLGYYRRARDLAAAARELVRAHGGCFPRDAVAARALSGVGPYTAGAVLSIAYDLPEALVDGNVERVFARLFGLELTSGSSALRRRAWQLAAALVPERGAGTWNQALMELGATICTPLAPRCLACPLARDCQARRAGRAQITPAEKAAARVRRRRPGALVGGGGRAPAPRACAAGGRLALLWQLPTRELAPPEARGRLFASDWPAPAAPELGESLLELRHSITCHRIRARVHRARLARVPSAWTWVELASAGNLGVSGMTRKALRALAPPSAPLDRTH